VFSFIDLKLCDAQLVIWNCMLCVKLNLYIECLFIWNCTPYLFYLKLNEYVWVTVWIFIYEYLCYMCLEIAIICLLYWIVIVIISQPKFDFVYKMYVLFCIVCVCLFNIWVLVFVLTWNCLMCVSLFGIVKYVFSYLNLYFVSNI